MSKARAKDENLKPGQLKSADPSLGSLCRMAVDLFEADVAVLLLKSRGITRVVASSGIETGLRSHDMDDLLPKFAASKDILLKPQEKPEVMAKLAFLGQPQAQWLFRTPVDLGRKHAFLLAILGSAPRAKTSKRELRLLADIKKLIKVHFRFHASALLDPDAHVTASTTLAAVRRKVSRSDVPCALLDANLKVVAMSPGLATEFGKKAKSLVGLHHADFPVPMSETLEALFRHSLDARVSPPEFELVVGEGRDVFNIAVSPFSPLETKDYFLLVTARKTTRYVADSVALAKQIGTRQPTEPTFAFLHETLVQKRAIRSRKSVSYITLRSWRANVKPWQVKALRTLKAAIPHDAPAIIAEEIAGEMFALVGHAAFKVVVPVPCGHSSEDSCLSLEIARALAARLQLPVVQAFTSKPRRGSSHPKENAKRPPLHLARVVTDPILLVDDVATSGAHIEEAVKLLRPHSRSVLAMAWIAGEGA